ncbi:hypothetical protein LZ554_001842 [Drepanopeziza brunnea f. sp. 'monogermtubi']|nr:hypothetical protein LZ554_001842 [Drepanopeziza brunnea f. sp. 'monogermtubi']
MGETSTNHASTLSSGISKVKVNSASTSTSAPRRRARQPRINLSTGDIASRVPPRQPKVNRKDGRESKGGLRAMFTRNKVEKEKSPILPVAEETPRSGIFEGSTKAMAEAKLRRSLSIKKLQSRTGAEPTVSQTPVPATTGQPTSRPSRLTLRTIFVKEVKTPSESSSAGHKSSKHGTKYPPRLPTRTSPAWDPPPLFQAYPQAVKHAQLSASTLSTDAILRLSSQHKRNSSLRRDLAKTTSNEPSSTAARKTEKATSKHRSQLSDSISKADWTQKIFVLVTSGYLVQYSGDGSYDRLPEKIMQLGKDSVAFASDVIPGKHWVLQISQAMDSDGTPTSGQRSLLSRLTFRRADYKRVATSMLLVLDNAEDMDSWLALLRREIESLGGKKHGNETGKPTADDRVMQLRAQPSHRYITQQNPHQISEPPTPHSQTPSPQPSDKDRDDELQSKYEDAASLLKDSFFSSVRPSTGHMSVSESVTSSDVKDSTNRLSYMSSGQQTLITSQCSTPATSPIRERASFDEFMPSVWEARPLTPNAAVLNERRRSIRTVQVPVSELQAKHRPSILGGPAASIVRNRSSGITPNFSVPNSSSKRYSTVQSPLLSSPTATATAMAQPPESILKDTRKEPLAGLQISRPLSPLKDSPQALEEAIIITPTDMATSPVTHAKPSVDTTPPRSPAAPSPQAAAHPPKSRSSLVSLSGPEPSLINFNTPRRYSSVQTLREISENQSSFGFGPPLRPAPLPHAPLSTPLPSSPLGQSSGMNSSTIEISPTQFPTTIRPQSRARLETTSPVPAPVLGNTETKFERPTSIRVDTSLSKFRFSSTTSRLPSHPQGSFSPPPSVRPFSAQGIHPTRLGGHATPPTSLMSPLLQRVTEEDKSATHQRGTPTLVNGPPLAPPPKCALPPIPLPGSADTRSPTGSSGSLRVGA